MLDIRSACAELAAVDVRSILPFGGDDDDTGAVDNECTKGCDGVGMLMDVGGGIIDGDTGHIIADRDGTPFIGYSGTSGQ